MKWHRATGWADYESDTHQVRRFESGLRGGGVSWMLYRLSDGTKVHSGSHRGGWSTLREAKAQAELDVAS